MSTYLIKYAGAVEVEADTEDEAEMQAWIEHGIHAEDIESIEATDEETMREQLQSGDAFCSIPDCEKRASVIRDGEFICAEHE